MFDQLLSRWVGWVVERPRAVLLALSLMTAVFGWVAVSQFKINSDLTQLIRQEAEWRVDFDLFQEEFPELTRTAVVVLSSSSLQRLELATESVINYLEEKPDRFSNIFAPGHDQFIQDHMFLYMSLEQLDLAVDRLAQAQPWLSAASQNPSLVGIFDLLIEGLENNPPERFGEILEVLSGSMEKTLQNEDNKIWWGDEIFPLEKARYQLIYVKAPANFLDPLPDAKFIEELRLMLTKLDLPSGVDAKLTGEIPLQHEEIEAAIDGVALAGWIALVLLFLVMFVGVRSFRIILGTFVLLGIGITWTIAYALLSVGEFNTLSLIFVVMFFGLGVDFALHYSLRFQEAVSRDQEKSLALVDSAKSVGRAISLGAVTTAVGFLGFWPTDYQGLADLGVISAGGMLIACFLAFTFLPAFYSVIEAPRAHTVGLPSSDRIINWLIEKKKSVIVSAVVVAALAGSQALQLNFDYSVLALKDPEAQSMIAHRELQDQGISTDYSVCVVGDKSADKPTLVALDTVKDVSVVEDLVPSDQEEKIFIIEDLQFMMSDALEPSEVIAQPTVEEIKRASVSLLGTLSSSVVSNDSRVPREVLERLSANLESMQLARDEQWITFQNAVVSDLVIQMQKIRNRIQVEEIEFQNLPDSVVGRLISSNGQKLSVVVPSQNMDSISNLSDFIETVRALSPNATGRPVIEWGVGSLVVDSFQTALIISAISILLILLLALRNILASFIVLVPLLLAALVTFGIAVFSGISINMANILVVPLIFGLGAASGIHVVDRYLGESNVSNLMLSSTPRAVILSNLTTVGAFAPLSLSAHQGAASVGVLLTIAVCLLLVFTLFLLPVLLHGVDKSSE